MQDGLYVALSAQVALEAPLNTIADNVAKFDTVGFRATEVKFEDIVTGVGQNSISFASPGDTYLSEEPAGCARPESPFDFAIQGDAWFGIDTPAGTVMTRDGRFTMTDTGQLVTHEGYAVLDAGGAPIQLDPLNGAPAAGATASSARAPAGRRRSACSISIRARISTASAIRASSRRASRILSSTASMPASSRVSWRSPTSTRCSK